MNKYLAIPITIAAFALGYFSKSDADREESSQARKAEPGPVWLGMPAKGEATGVQREISGLGDLMKLLDRSDGGDGLVKFYAALSQLESGELDALIDEFAAYPEGADKSLLGQHLIQFLRLSSPAKALVLQRTAPDSLSSEELYRWLGATDSEFALNSLSEETSARTRSTALDQIIRGASESDPEEAFLLLGTTPDIRNKHYRQVFKEWAAKDPRKAASTALTIESAAARSDALKALGKGWAEVDPVAALAWADSADLNAVERQRLLGAALESYAQTDAQAALLALEQSGLKGAGRILPDIIEQLMIQDPKAAQEWLNSQENSYRRSQVLGEISGTLAERHPELVIELSGDFPELGGKTLSSAFRQLARNSFDSARESLDQWKDDPRYDRLVEEVAKGASADRPEEVLRWAQELDPGVRSRASSAALREIGGVDPAAAAAWLAENANATEIDPDVYGSIADRWAKTDPEAAAEWANELEEGEPKSEATEEVAKEWGEFDPIATSEWVNEIPDGPVRDVAVEELVRSIHKTDPESAYAWGLTISDAEDRRDLVDDVLENWLKIDRATAIEIIADEPILTEERKQELYAR